MARFALRGLPMRDAFDSTFDTIVRMPRFELPDSRALLTRRVVAMPEVLVLFCHALSGGIPRDLIRFARQCLDNARAGDKTAIPTAIVVKAATAEYANELIDAAVIRSRLENCAALQPLGKIQRALARADPAEISGLLMRGAYEDLAADETLPELPDPAASRLPVAVLSTVCEYFGLSRTDDEWQEKVHAEIATELAACNADLSLDAGVAIERLTEVRRKFGLRPLPHLTQCRVRTDERTCEDIRAQPVELRDASTSHGPSAGSPREAPLISRRCRRRGWPTPRCCADKQAVAHMGTVPEVAAALLGAARRRLDQAVAVVHAATSAN